MQYTTTVSAGIPEATDPPDLPYLFDAAVAPIDGYLDQYLKDWGWANVALNGGFAYQNAVPMAVRRIGKQVSARWGVSSSGITATNTTYNIGTVPVDYRPAQTTYFNYVSSNPGYGARGIVYSGSGIVDLIVPTGWTIGPYFLFPAGTSWLVD